VYDNDDEYPTQKAVKQQPAEKPKKTADDAIEDLDSLKKLEPLYKGSASIKGFLARKSKLAKKA
jgi:hypothetical protein